MKYPVFLFLLISPFLFSCSKEKILERRLEGRWDVTLFQKSVFTNNAPVLGASFSYSNVGSITFNDNGTGSYDFVYDLQESSFGLEGTFDWDNSSESVSFRESTGTKVFDVTKNSSSEIHLERTVKPYYFSDGEPGVVYTMTERFVMKK